MKTPFDYNSLALGFHLPGVDITSLSAAPLLKSCEPWENFLGILAGCTRGDFSNLPMLGPLLKKHDGYLFCAACCILAGSAGSWTVITDFCEEIESQADGNTSLMIEPIAATLGLSCDLRAIPYLLRLFDLSVTDDDLVSTEQSITYLLSDSPYSFIGTPGLIRESADHAADRAAYKKKVAAIYSRVQQKTGMDRPVAGGKIFDVVEIATTVQQILAPDSGYNGADKIYPYDFLFEAATGINFSLVWHTPAERKLVIGGTERTLRVSHNYSGARSIIESFLQRKDLDRYQPGQRYFFGHPIE